MVLTNFIRSILYFFVHSEKNLKKDIILSLIFFLLLALLYYSGLLQKYIVPPYIINGDIVTFGDAKDVNSWIKCSKLNINIIFENNCTLRHKITYGYFITFFPYNEILDKFYKTYLPLTFIFLFVITTVRFCERKKIIDLLIVSFAIFNPHTLLLLERGNWDLLIYFSIILVCVTNNNILKSLIIIFNTLIKYYPIVFLISIFTYKRVFLKNFFYLFLSVLIIIVFLFYYREPTIIIFKENLYHASFRYNFSAYAMIEAIKQLFKNENFFQIFILLALIFIFFDYIKKNIIEKEFSLNFSFEEKLFLISSLVVITCYFGFSNFYYRDVFFILCLPLLIKLSNTKKNLNIVLYIFLSKFIYNILTNNFIIWRKNLEFLPIRNFLDLITIIIILCVSIKLYSKLIQFIFRKNKT
jgi:hypothetical protein